MTSLPIIALLLAVEPQTVKVDQYPLRSGCAQSDPVVARLRAGDTVRIKFALAGGAQACYVVSATVDGKAVEGNLPADALTGLDEFERSRREAAPLSVSASAPAPAKAPIPLPPMKSANPEVARAVNLLNRNQPGEALEIVEKLLQTSPNDADLLALAGLAAYKSDNIRVALLDWKQSLYIRPDPAVERNYQFALRESQNDKSSEKKFGSHFLLRYDGAVADPATAQAMVAILEEEFTRVSFQLGCRAEEHIVTIVQSRDAYFKSTSAPGWSGGIYDGKIHIPVMEGTQATPRVRQVFAHELVHACLANIGAWPAWLHEGLAQRLSGETLSPGVLAAIKALAKEGKLPKLAGLGQTWGSKSAAEAQLAYGMARAAVDLFYQYHAEFGIRNLMNNPQALAAITEDLDKRLRE